jgi:hypothetical protein
MKLSQWHDGKDKPVHIGVYESDDAKGLGYNKHWYRFWDGKAWMNGSPYINISYKNRSISVYQDWPWRGIIK